jgi:hypothetical protein
VVFNEALATQRRKLGNGAWWRWLALIRDFGKDETTIVH